MELFKNISYFLFRTVGILVLMLSHTYAQDRYHCTLQYVLDIYGGKGETLAEAKINAARDCAMTVSHNPDDTAGCSEGKYVCDGPPGNYPTYQYCFIFDSDKPEKHAGTGLTLKIAENRTRGQCYRNAITESNMDACLENRAHCSEKVGADPKLGSPMPPPRRYVMEVCVGRRFAEPDATYMSCTGPTFKIVGLDRLEVEKRATERCRQYAPNEAIPSCPIISAKWED